MEKEIKKLYALIEEFELLVCTGCTDEIAHSIFKELIEDGLIASDLDTRDKVEDVLLIDVGYEFADISALNELAHSLCCIAIYDKIKG